MSDSDRERLADIERRLAAAVLNGGEVRCGDECSAGWGSYVEESALQPILADLQTFLALEAA